MTQPIGSSLRFLLLAVALLTGVTGLVMFLAPELAGDSLWPWKITPLVSRYLGALFIGTAVGAALGSRAAEWSQIRPLFPPGLTITGLSLVAAALHFGAFNPARLATSGGDWLFR
jgi:hypothetical protein